MSEKVLVIQSSSQAFQPAYRHIKETFPDSEVDVLVTNRASLRAQNIQVDAGEVYEVQAESFRWKAFSRRCREQLLAKEYSRVYVLFNDLSQGGYSNVFKIAQKINAGKIFGFDYYSRCRRLDGWYGLYFRGKKILFGTFSTLFSWLSLFLLATYFVPELILRSLWHRYLKPNFW